MNARISELPVWALGLLLTALLGGAVTSSELGRRAHGGWRAYPLPLARPLPKGLKRFSLAAALGGQCRIAADWAYIDSLQYLGDVKNQTDGRFQKTYALYSEVLWLDPSFRHAGRQGIAVLGWFLHRPAEAGALSLQAMAADPHDFRYAAYYGALGYQEKLDPAGVVEALRPEVMRPDAPEMLLRIVGNVYLKARDWDGAIKYWSWIQRRSQDPITRRQADQALRKARAALQTAVPPAPDKR
jgi:tetratricopeptide (TPR) repeat protein